MASDHTGSVSPLGRRGPPTIAYLCMEIALEPAIPTYGGGLGILAGDMLRSAADLDVPMIGVTLASRAGYLRQQIKAGAQEDGPDPWDPASACMRAAAKVVVPIDGRDVWVGAWIYRLRGHMGGSCPVVLLDTHLPENSAADQGITDRLYGGDTEYRLMQEIVLGIGGARMLRALGITTHHYHLNEGHAALLGLELLVTQYQLSDRADDGPMEPSARDVRRQCSFTTHTPVSAGHDRFSYELVGRLLRGYVTPDTLKRLTGDNELNMTHLALALCDYVNGVARRHADTSRAMFPGYRVHAITNGVHPFTWTAPAFRSLYDRTLPGWCHEPELLVRADCCLSGDAIAAAHAAAKQDLCRLVAERTGVVLRPEIATIGFARRMTSYKRPDLLFRDSERLRAIAAVQPIQVVLAGKAHPSDDGGKVAIQQLHAHIRALAPTLAMAFVPNYDMAVAGTVTAGVDVWLNTPTPPLEASGTSGMKAALNGVPSLSVLDGWWLEGCIEGVTGWAIGRGSSPPEQHSAEVYDLLEHKILPLFYGAGDGWVRVMRGAISRNGSYFHSHRMIRRYAAEAYLR